MVQSTTAVTAAPRTETGNILDLGTGGMNGEEDKQPEADMTSEEVHRKQNHLRKLLRMGSLLMERILRSTPNGVLMAHTEWLLDVRLRHFSTTCAVYIEDCEGLVVVRLSWLSGRVLAAQARCPGFNFWRLLAFSLSFIFASKTSNFSLGMLCY